MIFLMTVKYVVLLLMCSYTLFSCPADHIILKDAYRPCQCSCGFVLSEKEERDNSFVSFLSYDKKCKARYFLLQNLK